MKIAVIGDVHENEALFLRALTRAKEEGVSGLLLVGDLGDPVSLLGNPLPGPERYKAKLDELFDLIRTTLPGVQTYFVPGNHDAHDLMPSTPEILNIHKKVVEFNGVKIGGFGGSLPCGRTFPTEWEEDEALEQLYMSGSVDILLTHSPPHGVLDANLGSFAVLRYIEEFKPRFAVFGHIHEYVGTKSFYAGTGVKTICLNAGAFGPPNASPRMGMLDVDEPGVDWGPGVRLAARAPESAWIVEI